MQNKNSNITYLGRWIDLYQEPLYRYAFFRLGSRSDAEDVLQDAFLKVASSTTTIRNPKAYLFAAVASGCIDVMRRRTKSPLPIDTKMALSSPTTSEVPLEAEEEFCRINKLLSQLSEQQSEVIRLHIHAQMKFTEIAEVLSVPVSTVKSRWSSGIERLKQLYIN